MGGLGLGHWIPRPVKLLLRCNIANMLIRPWDVKGHVALHKIFEGAGKTLQNQG
jgi:hypothetical protein